MKINSKPPGPKLKVQAVNMDFSFGASFGVTAPEAYERLLLDCMRGDATLFTRNDEIELAWGVVGPVLSAWEREREGEAGLPVVGYQAGTWGPVEADQMLRQRVGRVWRRL